MHMSFHPEFSMRFNIEPVKPFKVKIVVSELVFQGTVSGAALVVYSYSY